MLAGALLTLFFTLNFAQIVRRARSELKHSGSSDTPTFKSINVTGPVKIGHVGSKNLTTFQTFGSHNFLFQYGTLLTESKS